jgi:predicted phage tail protein
MENSINKRRAICIMAVFGAVLILVATWNPAQGGTA